MKILIFTEGTILMHKSAMGLTRNRIILQVKNKENSVKDYASYIPIGNAAKKLQNWKKQGAHLFYLTSRTKTEEIKDIKSVLKKFNFPEGKLLFRKNNEKYCDVAERLMPNVLVEDNCKSMGGVSEITISNVNLQTKKKIKPIVVKEFEGIDFFPDEPDQLLHYK